MKKLSLKTRDLWTFYSGGGGQGEQSRERSESRARD